MRRELKHLRKKNEKHFLNDDGTIEAILYDDNVHYLKDGLYEEINNTLAEKDSRYHIIGNNFDLSFSKQNDENLLEFIKDGHYFKMSLRDSLKVYNKELKKDNKIRKRGSISYNNIFDNIDLNYQILPQKIKETIVFKDKSSIKDKIVFDIKTDLQLTLENNKIISENFTILDSFMIDSNNQINKEIYYILNKTNYGYELILILDKGWLECSDRKYPIYIDPTITVDSFDGIIDTYISNKYPSINYGGKETIKAGIFENDEKCMSLLKFNLPKIGTGSNIIDSRLYLYKATNLEDTGNGISMLTAHKITSDWNELTATWSNMNDKYATRMEDYTNSLLIDFDNTLFYTSFDITNLVKRWYAGEPNYGVLIKSHTDEYDQTKKMPEFISSNHQYISKNPEPYISVTYRNQNGLESYMTYQVKKISNGNIYFNNYNGNITLDLLVGSTISNKNSFFLNLFYNTNDVILERNYGYGIGFKTNYNQTLELIEILGQKLYEYVDEDGTIHYFNQSDGSDTTYIDEDALNLTLEINSDSIIMRDRIGNEKHFVSNDGNKYILTKIVNTKNNSINIMYSDDKIIKITNSDFDEINFSYGEDIVINSPSKNTILHLSNNKLIKLTDEIGDTIIEYNSNNIINKITDISGKKIQFEYYPVIPYRVKKVTNYGLNNAVGKSLEFTYGFETTSITNNKGKTIIYTFNEFGNTISAINFGENKNLNRSYGKNYEYGTYGYYKNKLLCETNLKKHVRNLIWNSSFEYDYNIFNSIGATAIITSESSYINDNSLKITGMGTVSGNIEIDNSGSHTFSFYAKSTIPFDVVLTSGSNHSEINVLPTNNYVRNEVTIDDANSYVNISFVTSSDGIIYLDALQLEEGMIANPYNVIDNSDFKYNLAGWIYDNNNSERHVFTPEEDIQFKSINNRNDEIITFDNGTRALKIICDPTVSRIIERNIPVKGEVGDSWLVSFWYKNDGLKRHPNIPEFRNNTIQLCLFPSPDSGAATDNIFYYANLNTNCDEWQYYTTVISTEFKYDSLRILIMSSNSANEYYLTNFSAYKINGIKRMNYDSNGNIISSMLNDGNLTTYKYDDNNQLIELINPLGNNVLFEYDREVNDRMLSVISPTGVANVTKYDEYGNSVLNKIENKTKLDLQTGIYYIRLKGTNKYLKIDIKTKEILLKSDTCSHTKWSVIVKENGKLTINPLISNQIYIDNNDISNLEFAFIKQDNGSFILKNNDNYLTVSEGKLILSSEKDLPNQTFYFEYESNIYIENNQQYTENGKYLKKNIDTLLNQTSYDINSETGFVDSITDACGNINNYIYTDKKQISSICKSNIQNIYSYNQNNLLSKISVGNRVYDFIYDNYLKLHQINLNGNFFIQRNYESNDGNLSSLKYANNHQIFFSYDIYDRLVKIEKMNDTFNYYYDNFDNLSKIISNQAKFDFKYDIAQRLIEYRNRIFNSEYIINYEYDKLNNLVKKNIRLDSSTNNYLYEYNEENNIKKIQVGNLIATYEYDELQRLKTFCINNYSINYGYKTNGKRTSTLINQISNGENTYRYYYDNIGNITKIYKNNEIINEYTYDEYNELVTSISNNIKTIYSYDNYGNIQTKSLYNSNNELISENLYYYENNNWLDQLTKYNDSVITYDNFGNVLTIASATLTWVNGRELNSYSDANLFVSYKYNNNGLRTQKNVNNKVYNYYLDGSVIDYMKIDNDILHFIRDLNNNLIGFEYSNNLYYYERNLQNDIMSIMNSNFETIVNYEYDDYGLILSIKDANGNIINDKNNIAYINPFRYRSYYYDDETELYYINSRYYNPKWGRFISPDTVLVQGNNVLSNNLYSYGYNNPIRNIDSTGNLPKWMTSLYESWIDGVEIIKRDVQNGLNKIGSTISNIGQNIKNAFVFETGLGFGVGLGGRVGPAEANIGFNKTANWGFGSGAPYQSSTTSAGIEIGLPSYDAAIGFKYENTHKIHGQNRPIIGLPYYKHDYLFPPISDIAGCENTSESILFGTNYKNFNTEYDGDKLFLGVEFEAFIGIGGRVKIGFDIDK